MKKEALFISDIFVGQKAIKPKVVNFVETGKENQTFIVSPNFPSGLIYHHNCKKLSVE